MAIIKCIECGKQFSSFADACPVCGCPTRMMLSARQIETQPAAQVRQTATPTPTTEPEKTPVVAPAPTPQEAPTATMEAAPNPAPSVAEITPAPEMAPSPVAAAGVTPTPVAPVVTPLVVPIVAPVAVAPTQTPTMAEINETVGNALSQANQAATQEYRALLCPACGSNDITIVASDYGVCTHCGSKILLKQENTSKAEIHIHGVGAQSGDYYGIKKTLAPTDFYRRALLKMVRSENTPPDLFDGQFEAAVLSAKHIAKFTGNIFGSYSAEVGYDMERTRQEWNGQRYVTKTERYIEWKPFSGSYAGTQCAYVSLDVPNPLDEGIESAFALFHLDEDIKKETCGTEDIVTPTEEHRERALNKCKHYAEKDVISGLPGNHYRNFSFSANGQITSTTCYTVPAYTMPFRYKEEDFALSAFAVESEALSSFGHIPDISDDIKADVDKKTRPIGIISIVSLSFSIILSLLLGGLHNYIHRAVGLGVCISLFVGALAVTIFYWVYRKRYHQSIVGANKRAKLRGVSGILQTKTLAPITSDEEDAIMGRKRK